MTESPDDALFVDAPLTAAMFSGALFTDTSLPQSENIIDKHNSSVINMKARFINDPSVCMDEALFPLPHP
jgi:hypothetical protein